MVRRREARGPANSIIHYYKLGRPTKTVLPYLYASHSLDFS